MKVKVYDLVWRILEEHEEARSSDKELIWIVWQELGLTFNNNSCIDLLEFGRSPSLESITRARRKVQELHPELAAVKNVEKLRNKKEATRGTFIFREKVIQKGK